MKICVFSDIHGNLEQLEKLMKSQDFLTADLKICLGDIVGLGPYQKECIDLIQKSNCICLLGNHEARYIKYINDLNPQKCMFKQFEFFSKDLLPKYFDFMKNMPLIYEIKINDKILQFMHYGWHNGNVTNKIKELANKNLFEQFNISNNVNYVFYGHMHAPRYDYINNVHFYDVGSLGLKSPSNYIMIYTDNVDVKVERKFIEADREKFLLECEKVNFPAWQMLLNFCFDNDKEVY